MVYNNPHVSSVYGCHPWFVIPMVENHESQRMIHDSFVNEEMAKASSLTVPIHDSNGRQIDSTHEVKPALLDGKCTSEICGLKGAYCTMCKVSMAEGMMNMIIQTTNFLITPTHIRAFNS